MDFTGALKTEIFRPLATIVIPGAIAIAPYAMLASHYNPGLADFVASYPSAYGAMFVAAAIAAGMLLEDIGGVIEEKLWDNLLERETKCLNSTWHAFLKLAPRAGEELVAHRYLRTLVLRLKFELSVGLAMICFWFGIVWLDSNLLLWTDVSIRLLSSIVLAAASYALWESYRTSWGLARVRHLIVHGSYCKLEERPTEVSPRAPYFDYFLFGTSMVILAQGALGLVRSLTQWTPITNAILLGPVMSLLLALFGVVGFLSWSWIETGNGVGRRRGVALRFAFCYGLLGLILQFRRLSEDRGPHAITLAEMIVVAIVFLWFGRDFWVAPINSSPSGLPSSEPPTE